MNNFEKGDIVIRVNPVYGGSSLVEVGKEYIVKHSSDFNIGLELENVPGLWASNSFKLKENNMKEFTKADLRTGMRVTTRAGDSFVVMLDTANHGDVLSRVNCWLKLSGYTLDLKYTNSEGPCSWCDIMKVATPKFADFYAGGGENSLLVLWERQEKSQAQIELETLQAQITALQEQADKIQKAL